MRVIYKYLWYLILILYFENYFVIICISFKKYNMNLDSIRNSCFTPCLSVMYKATFSDCYGMTNLGFWDLVVQQIQEKETYELASCSLLLLRFYWPWERLDSLPWSEKKADRMNTVIVSFKNIQFTKKYIF